MKDHISNDVLTIDLEATREAIRIKFKTSSNYARLSGLASSTVFSILNGTFRYFNNPSSVYQAVLRQMQADGVLVECSDLKEAA